MLARDNLRLRLTTLRRLIHPPRTCRLAGSLSSSRQLLGHSWHAPRTSLTGPVGPHRALAVLRLDLATVKDVAHAHDGKVNDVVLNLAAGGLRALLRSRGERVDRIDIHAAVAASPRTRSPAPRTGNRAGIIVVKLPLGEPDPAVRLRLISANSNIAKHEQLLTTAQGLMLWLARLGLLRRFTRRQRLTITVRVDADRHPDVPVLVTAMADDWRSLMAKTGTDQLLRRADASTGTPDIIRFKVTSWAAIIAVPTAVTGFYGQNLPYPGFGSHWGVLASTALIAALSAGLYGVFKRNDWL